MSNEEQNKEDPIGKALGLDPIEKNIQIIDNMLAEAHDDSATKDFELARSNIHELISEGSDAIQKLSQIASTSQHPRAFEVLAKLMETMLNANRTLLDMQEKIRDIRHADSPINEQAKNITNNLFVGSTAELQKVIKEMKNE